VLSAKIMSINPDLINECALRIYDFPTFYTQDHLLAAIKDLESHDYEFKWINQNETYLIFKSKEAARTIYSKNLKNLDFKISMEKTEHDASTRPVKTDVVAKRMVAGALGIKVVDQECPKLEKAIHDKKKRQIDLDQAWEE
jgi:hypothetical protein